MPGESHRQRSLTGYSPFGNKESDRTKLLTDTHKHTHTHKDIEDIQQLYEVNTTGKIANGQRKIKHAHK